MNIGLPQVQPISDRYAFLLLHASQLTLPGMRDLICRSAAREVQTGYLTHLSWLGLTW